MIYEYFRVTGVHDTVLDYLDLFTLTLQNDGTKFCCRWAKFPQMISWKTGINYEYVSLDRVRIIRDGDSSEEVVA